MHVTASNHMKCQQAVVLHIKSVTNITLHWQDCMNTLKTWVKLMCFNCEFTLNKSPTRCNSMQSDLFHCIVTLRVSGVTAPIIRSTKNCNRNLRYRSYCEIQGLTGMN